MKNFITEQMVSVILHALYELISKKGSLNKMVTVEDIEEFLLFNNEQYFVPVNLTLSSLLKAGRVRYFKLENGRTMWGFTQKSKDFINGYTRLEPQEELLKGEEIDITDDNDFPFMITEDDLPTNF